MSEQNEHKYEHISLGQIPKVVEEVNTRRKIALQMKEQIENQYAEALRTCEEALKECDDDLSFLEYKAKDTPSNG